MKYIRKFNKFRKVLENISADAPAKPKTRPTTTPKTTPKTPSPFRRDKPSVMPKPKAEKTSVDELINIFKDMASKEDIQEIVDHYKKEGDVE